MTLVHFVMPYWGDPSLLDQAVDSVLTQSDPDWRLTIVDDAYPDSRPKEHYATYPDERVEYVRNMSNLGVAGNFEECRRLANGELVVFLGSDDMLLPCYVADLRNARSEHPHAQILQPGVEVIGSDGSRSNGLVERVKSLLRPRGKGPCVLEGEPLAISLLRGNWLYWPSLAFDRTALEGHSFRQDLPVILDLAFVMELVLMGATLVTRDEVSFLYRRHEGSASSISALHGSRFDDERRYYAEIAAVLGERGWHDAAVVARHRLVSRLHAISLIPSALRHRSRRGLAAVVRHAFSR